MRLNLRLGNDVGWCVFVGGMYEANELAFLAAVLEPGMTFVDVGANEGLFTLVGASSVGDGGRVLAVEPSSREFERLGANIALNALDNVEASRLASTATPAARSSPAPGSGTRGRTRSASESPIPASPRPEARPYASRRSTGSRLAKVSIASISSSSMRRAARR